MKRIIAKILLGGLAVFSTAVPISAAQPSTSPVSYTANNSLPHANCYWVHPQQFMAGEYPGDKTALATRAKLSLYLDKGVRAFIDLTEEGELQPYEHILYELAQERNVSVTYKRISIVDMSIPTAQTMHEIIDTIKSELNAQRPVYVHCWGGIGRTGTVVACYLTSLGMTGDQALEQLAGWWKHVAKSKQYPFSPQTREQVHFVLQYR